MAHPIKTLEGTSHRFKGFAFILLAALLWGSLGMFYKTLIGVYGLSVLTIAFVWAAFSPVFVFNRIDGIAAPVSAS